MCLILSLPIVYALVSYNPQWFDRHHPCPFNKIHFMFQGRSVFEEYWVSNMTLHGQTSLGQRTLPGVLKWFASVDYPLQHEIKGIMRRVWEEADRVPEDYIEGLPQWYAVDGDKKDHEVNLLVQALRPFGMEYCSLDKQWSDLLYAILVFAWLLFTSGLSLVCRGGQHVFSLFNTGKIIQE